jgi:tetratricopeptide (TPR) repeat protein
MAGFVTLRGAASDISRILSHQPAPDSLTGENREAGVSLIWRHIAEATAASQSARIGQALAASRRAMEISRQIDDQVLWARAGITHALSLFASGQVVQSTALIRRVADAADRLNDGITGAGILTVSCHVSSWLFDPNAAEIWLKHELDKPRMADASHLRIILFDWLQLVAAIGGKLPSPDRIVAHVQTNPPSDTLVLFYHGEWERAEPELSRAVDQAREEGRHISTCTSGHWLARLWRAVALRGKAEAKLHENLAIAIEAPHLALELNTRAELASILAETGRPDQARPHLARCREVIAAGEDWRGLVGHIERAEAVVAAAEARFDDANRHFEQAAAIYRRYQVPFEQAEALHYWGRALTAAGGRGAALEKLDGATELYRRHGAGQRWLEGVRVDRLRAQSIGTVVARESRAALSANLQAGLADRNNGDRRHASPMAAGFRRQGEYWTLSRADLESQLRDRKGLRYIACLLRYPGQEFAALEMAAAIEHGNGSPLASVRASAGRETNTSSARGLGDAGAALDASARAQYKRRLEDLRHQLELAEEVNDIGRAARAREEIEFIEDQVSAAVGLGGRDRKNASPAERARVAVTKAIKTAVGRIRIADPELGRHLALSIQTGYFCVYRPRQQVDWEL